MKSIDAIIFDLGGVFIEIDYTATISEFEKLGFENANHLYSQSEQAYLFEQFEKGEISPPHFINKLLISCQFLLNRILQLFLILNLFTFSFGK